MKTRSLDLFAFRYFNRRSDAGFSLVEVMLALFVTCVITIGVAGSFAQFTAQQQQILNRNSSMIVTANLRRALSDESAMMNMLFNPENDVFDCLRPKKLDPKKGDAGLVSTGNCKNKSGTLKRAVSSAGEELLNFDDPTAGFTSSGEACKGFGTDPNCSMRARIDVKFVCDNGGSSCKQPEIIFTGTIETNNGIAGGPITQIGQTIEVRKDWASTSLKWLDLSDPASAVTSKGPVLPFKLVIIVDNSTSMKVYQERLATNLVPLLEKLRTFDFELRVQVLSSSQYVQYRANIWEYDKPQNTVHQILNLDSVSCSNGTVTKTGYCQDWDVWLYGFQTEKYSMKPAFEAVLAPKAPGSDFNAFRDSIISVIANMGVSGSDDEQSLCSLSRLLTGGNSFLQVGDRMGVILISNEEDHSTTASCASEIQRKHIPGQDAYSQNPQYSGETAADPTTNYIEYGIKQKIGNAGYNFAYRCSAYKDGDFVPYNASDTTTYTGNNEEFAGDEAMWYPDHRAAALNLYGIDIDKSCAASGLTFDKTRTIWRWDDGGTYPDAACPSSVISKIEENGYNCTVTDSSGAKKTGKMVPGTCRIICADNLNYGVKTVPGPSHGVMRQFDHFEKNYCSAPLTLGAQETTVSDGNTVKTTKTKDASEAIGGDTVYANILQLFTSQGYTVANPGTSQCVRIGHSQRPKPDNTGNLYTSVYKPFGPTCGLAIQDAILTRANEMFGAENFFISTIINPSDPGTACTLTGADESVGAAFESLAQKAPNKAIVPICSNDYTPALAPLEKFITSVIPEVDNSLVKLAQGEQIVQIVVDDGKGKAVTYQVAGPTGVWPTLQEKVADSTEKIYKLDFSKTGYELKDTDKVYVLVVSKGSQLTIGKIGDQEVDYDGMRSLFRIGLGH